MYTARIRATEGIAAGISILVLLFGTAMGSAIGMFVMALAALGLLAILDRRASRLGVIVVAAIAAALAVATALAIRAR